jgi:hypothetical protein
LIHLSRALRPSSLYGRGKLEGANVPLSCFPHLRDHPIRSPVFYAVDDIISFATPVVYVESELDGRGWCIEGMEVLFKQPIFPFRPSKCLSRLETSGHQTPAGNANPPSIEAFSTQSRSCYSEIIGIVTVLVLVGCLEICANGPEPSLRNSLAHLSHVNGPFGVFNPAARRVSRVIQCVSDKGCISPIPRARAMTGDQR